MHVVLAEIHESVSLYFDQDCLRKNKMVFSGALVGRKFILSTFLLEKTILSTF